MSWTPPHEEGIFIHDWPCRMSRRFSCKRAPRARTVFLRTKNTLCSEIMPSSVVSKKKKKKKKLTRLETLARRETVDSIRRKMRCSRMENEKSGSARAAVPRRCGGFSGVQNYRFVEQSYKDKQKLTVRYKQFYNCICVSITSWESNKKLILFSRR